MLLSRRDLLKKAAIDISHLSPLIVQGDAGIGKTFFVNRLCNMLCDNKTIKNFKVLYSWDILNSMIEALSSHKMSAWRNELFSSDLIVIEEFHFLNNKSVALEELYQMIRTANIPIIIISDQPINNTTFACAEMVAFLKQCTHIILPSPTREDIEDYLKYLLEDIDFHLSEEAFDWLINQKINSLTIATGIVKTLKLYSNDDAANIELDDCITVVKPLILESE